jgi:hypothetical protein
LVLRHSFTWLHALILSTLACGTACRKTQPPGDSQDQGVTTMVGCEEDKDCPPNLPTCLSGELGAHVCVGCIVGMNTCNAGYECDNDSHTCQLKAERAPECVRDSDCPPLGPVSERSICRISKEEHVPDEPPPRGGICVECQIDDDCGPPVPVCDNGVNRGIPDLGHVPTFKCINGCDLCAPPLICDAVNKVCI